MALSFSTISPDGMNGVVEGRVRINVSVDVLKANKTAARNAIVDAAAEFEAEDE